MGYIFNGDDPANIIAIIKKYLCLISFKLYWLFYIFDMSKLNKIIFTILISSKIPYLFLQISHIFKKFVWDKKE